MVQKCEHPPLLKPQLRAGGREREREREGEEREGGRGKGYTSVKNSHISLPLSVDDISKFTQNSTVPGPESHTRLTVTTRPFNTFHIGLFEV